MRGSNPWCPHGPTLLFERSGKKFYACAAFRQRKDCSAYFEFGAKDKRWTRWKSVLEEGARDKREARLSGKFCRNCNLLVNGSHDKGHQIEAVTREELRFPTRVLTVLDASKKEAQFHFDQETLGVITRLFRDNNIGRVVCVGAPSVHEHLRASKGLFLGQN